HAGLAERWGRGRPVAPGRHAFRRCYTTRPDSLPRARIGTFGGDHKPRAQSSRTRMTPYDRTAARPVPARHARIAIGVALAAASILAPPAAAQSGPAFRPVPNAESAGFSAARLARIDSMVERSIAAGEIPGAVVFIARHGRVVMHRAYGVRDASTRVPMRGDDIFRIASQSKAITALAV